MLGNILEYERKNGLSPKKSSNSLLHNNARRDLLAQEREDIFKQQNERLLNFAYIVSHNLRSHAGNLSLMLKFFNEAKSESERTKIFDHLLHISELFTDTVSNLDKVVTAQANCNDKPEKLNLREYVERTIEVLRGDINEHSATIDNYVPPFVLVEAIPAYLESILLNILSNAIKYRNDDKKPEIVIQVFNKSRFLMLQVTDNGKGMDLSKCGKKLFGMFQTFHGNKDAKGIGLFITKNQVESMGGKIEVESEVGKGTTFKIYLPYC